MLRDDKVAASLFGRHVSASLVHAAAHFRQRRAISISSNISLSAPPRGDSTHWRRGNAVAKSSRLAEFGDLGMSFNASAQKNKGLIVVGIGQDSSESLTSHVLRSAAMIRGEPLSQGYRRNGVG